MGEDTHPPLPFDGSPGERAIQRKEKGKDGTWKNLSRTKIKDIRREDFLSAKIERNQLEGRVVVSCRV